MLRGMTWMMGALLILGGCWWFYNHVKEREVPNNGDVILRAAPPDSKDIPDTKSQAGIDGNTAQPTTPPVQTASAPSSPTPASATSTAPTIQTPAPQAAPSTQSNTALPVSDTLPSNSPNGMAFGGSGRYQWFRQGNITWRIDTRSGATCIDFATLEEWSKRLVYSHGCRRA